MTFAAPLVADGFEIVAVRVHDLMRGVAIRADRPALVAFGQQLSVDALVVSLLDAQMTFAAGLGDIGVVDGRITIHVALDVMHAVAIVARGRHNQAHLDQRLPVDAVHVLRGRLGILHFVFLRQPWIAVAFGAGVRQVHFENRRSRIIDRQNVMRAVAIPAIGRAGGAERVAHAVDARGVILGLFLVADGAIGRRQTGWHGRGL